MYPGYSNSSPSSPPNMEPSQPSEVDSAHILPIMDAKELDPVEQIEPSKRFKSSESMNPGHHGSTPSSPLGMEPSQPLVDSVHPSPPMGSVYEKLDPVEQIESSQRVRFSDSMKPGHHGSTPSSPPGTKPSLPSLVDSLHSSPSKDSVYEKIDSGEQINPSKRFMSSASESKIDPLEQIKPSKRFKSSESMNPSHNTSSPFSSPTMELSQPSPVDSVRISTPMDAIESIKEIYEKIDPVEQIDILITIVENQLHRINNPSEAGSSSSEGWENTCRELLHKILKLGRDVKDYSEQMPDEIGKLCNAVRTIVEGAVICSNYKKRENFLSFSSATTAAAQLEKTNQQMRDVRDSLDLSVGKDVFLSHSGKQKNFVRQLHVDLTREHFSCFFDEDDHSLPLAHRFPPLIFKAAETCKIAVVVLSKDFICSKWPMLELAAFIDAMKSGKNANLKLLPVFFMITPKELSHITKDSPEWKKLEESDVRRGEWQDALKKVRSMKGLQLGEGANEVDCRAKVLNAIRCILNGINPPKLLDFEPVGIEQQVAEVKAKLDMEGDQSAAAVIVCGFGGIGKSTIAASVVQSLEWSSTDLKFCWVVIDEKTPDQTSHIIKLQKDIIYDLDGVKVDLRHPLEGRLRIEKALKNKFSLLFIDNVVDKTYMQELLPKDLSPEDQDLKTKLRILVTSREETVKAELYINCMVHEVHTLYEPASQRLLFETILQNNKVVEDEDFDEKSMINQVADACRGVPLLLTVFGKHLRYERNNDSYQEALDVLRKGNLQSYRDEDLGTKLMFVYHKIKDVEAKEAFLDICTYFNGWEWDLVADIVDFPKLEDLRRRMLVSKSGSGKMIVHDILRLMGMKEANLTRFSNYKELSDALEDNLHGFDVKYVKGLSLVNGDCLTTIQSIQLEAMSQSLRVLILGDWVTLEGPPCQKKFTNLRYLCVGDITAFPFQDSSKLDKLRVILNRSKSGMNLSHLPPSLKRISHEVKHVECDKFVKLPFQNLSCLKSFTVKTKKSVELPEELHLPASLVDLNINRCKNLPKDISHLTALESLILDGSDLECLPQFGQFKKLKHLNIEYCSKLAFLPEVLRMLYSLEALSMKGCGNLRALPKSLGGLFALQTLELSECINLEMLPESFGELRIQSLNLHLLVNLNNLPNSFGNMPLLKDLSLKSCHSLLSLPKSFVQLKMLETLMIIKCNKLSVLPENFGRLRCLKHMTVAECHLLNELPHGFISLPALKTLTLRWCNSFVNLPRDIGELTSLEQLNLFSLRLLSSFPDGFGTLQKLRFLNVGYCLELKALSEDFENLATLERLSLSDCSKLDGAIMETILKLQNCYSADIYGSRKLSERWQHMQDETEHPIVVFNLRDDWGDLERGIRGALLHGKCMEMNNATGQLMERSSLLVGLGEGITATVAVIMLPINMQSHQQEAIQRYVKMARETAESNGSEKLQIVCARRVDFHAEKPTAREEEERAEEEGIRQILLLLPEGSCAIPSSESKRVKVLACCCGITENSRDKLAFFTLKVGVDVEGRKSIQNLKFTFEDTISRNVGTNPSRMNTHYNSIQNFIKSICPVYSLGVPKYLRRRPDWQCQSECAVGESKTREFVEALKGNGIHHLLMHNSTSKVMVDDLLGKAIGFIICGFEFLEWIELQQIYNDLQQKDSNFIWIWIPVEWPKDCGHGSYTRFIQCMPWATFPLPQLVNIKSHPCFVLLNKHGQITNHDALPLLLGWGVKSYPFTEDTIPESFSLAESESCLEFLLHGMNIIGRKPMKSKITFLFAHPPCGRHKMKSMLEELTQIRGSFEVLYVGKLYERDIYDTENFKQEYEDAIQNMRWPSLSFSDMIMFWYRCKYLASEKVYELNKESNIMVETLHGLAKQLHRSMLVLVDKEGAGTCTGHDVLQMLCDSSDKIWDGEEVRMVKDELMKSLTRGECTPLVKTFFRDKIHNHPLHPEHPISLCSNRIGPYTCGVCGANFTHLVVGNSGTSDYGWFDDWNEQRSYRCDECRWAVCASCWMAYAKQQVETT